MKWPRTLGAALALGGLATLTACAPEVTRGPEIIDPIDVTVATATTRATLPPGAQSLRVVALDATPRAIDDLFVSTLFPNEDRPGLAIVGFDQTGTQWSLGTNPACAGWAATRSSDGTGIVVALNSDARVENGMLAENTLASGFTAATGHERWSSQAVIGPIIGNGALFTGARKAIISAEQGDTQTLAPDDGAALVLPDAWSAANVVHEHFGVVLLSLGDLLAAADSTTGELLWSREAPAIVVPGASAGHAITLRSDTTPQQMTVVHLSTGETIARAPKSVRAVPSADGTQTLMVTGAETEQHISLLNATGTLWTHTVPATRDLLPLSVGAGHAYLDAGATRIVLNSHDGSEIHNGSFAAPIAVTTSGHGLIRTGIPGQYEMVHLAD